MKWRNRCIFFFCYVVKKVFRTPPPVFYLSRKDCAVAVGYYCHTIRLWRWCFGAYKKKILRALFLVILLVFLPICPTAAYHLLANLCLRPPQGYCSDFLCFDFHFEYRYIGLLLRLILSFSRLMTCFFSQIILPKKEKNIVGVTTLKKMI